MDGKGRPKRSAYRTRPAAETKPFGYPYKLVVKNIKELQQVQDEGTNIGSKKPAAETVKGTNEHSCSDSDVNPPNTALHTSGSALEFATQALCTGKLTNESDTLVLHKPKHLPLDIEAEGSGSMRNNVHDPWSTTSQCQSTPPPLNL